jgi:hypothetical protein
MSGLTTRIMSATGTSASCADVSTIDCHLTSSRFGMLQLRMKSSLGSGPVESWHWMSASSGLHAAVWTAENTGVFILYSIPVRLRILHTNASTWVIAQQQASKHQGRRFDCSGRHGGFRLDNTPEAKPGMPAHTLVSVVIRAYVRTRLSVTFDRESTLCKRILHTSRSSGSYPLIGRLTGAADRCVVLRHMKLRST